MLLLETVTQPRSQGLSSYRPIELQGTGDSKMGDPGNEVDCYEENSVIYCRFHQRLRVPSRDDKRKGLKKCYFSNENTVVCQLKTNQNASVAENILLRFIRDEKGDS